MNKSKGVSKVFVVILVFFAFILGGTVGGALALDQREGVEASCAGMVPKRSLEGCELAAKQFYNSMDKAEYQFKACVQELELWSDRANQAKILLTRCLMSSNVCESELETCLRK